MIAVIPARGGSKSLPRKNVLPLAGKPLIVHTLESALAASRVSRVIVTTDDGEIAEIARSVPGVEVPFLRPQELAQDDTSSVDAYAHLVDWLQKHEGTAVKCICALLPTAPLRRPEDIDACIDLFEKRDAIAVVSVVSAKPAAWQQIIDTDGRLSSLPGIAPSIDNRQGFGRTVIPNGAVQVFDMPELVRTRSYFGPRTYGYEMPSDRSIDIDTEADFRIAEALLSARSSR